MPVAAFALAAALAVGPATPAPSQVSCINLNSSNIRYYPVDDHTVLVSAGLRAYRITTTPTPLLADPASVVTVSYPMSSSVVCSPTAINLRITGPSGRAGLIVQSIEPLSREVAADLRKGGPRRSEGLLRGVRSAPPAS